MLVEWIAREGWIIASWWLLVTLAGVAVLPLLATLLDGLPDRGFTLARAAGLLVVGFVFWLMASMGLVRNTAGAMILAWMIVLAGSLMYAARRGAVIDWRAWWRSNRAVIGAGEALFLLMLIGWAVYRAHLPNLTGTEKPMELMFMSSIQQSATFPPNDGWMSGYAISYYYFGYVMSAMLSTLSGITSTVGFNMTIALLFALTGLTSFGVAANLARAGGARAGRALAVGLLAAFFVAVMGNFQAALIEWPYQSRTASEAYLQFWGTPERDIYPERSVATAQGIPADQPVTLGSGIADPFAWPDWWWFRASRVIRDVDLNGMPIGVQPIDEFPQFSFLLADVHPHVLALPFAALALGLALNLLLNGRAPNRDEIIFYGLCLGGLVFLNAWDGPIYMIALVGADGLRRLMRSRSRRLSGGDWLAMIGLGGALVVLTAVLYFPFFVSFRSQASGVLPNLLFPTLFQQYFIMFGPFVLILAAFLALEIWRAGDHINWRMGLSLAGLLLLGLTLFMLLLFLLGLLLPGTRELTLSQVDSFGGFGVAAGLFLEKRLTHSLTALLLTGAIAIVIARLFPRAADRDSAPDAPLATYTPATGFALLLVAIGAVLTLVPEFLYLRDNFGVRINTVFKFYYQAWLAFGLASAFGVYALLADERLRLPAPPLRALMAGVLALILVVGSVYPTVGINSRMNNESGRAMAGEPRPLTLDGASTMVGGSDYAAIMCFRALTAGRGDLVVAEARDPASAYDWNYGRVAALTGVPIVLGWENHQRQWRGPTYNEVAGTRAADMETLYSDLRWDVALTIIERYDIDYIFYGRTERIKYSAIGNAGERKFIENLDPVCDFGDSVFYRVNPERRMVVR